MNVVLALVAATVAQTAPPELVTLPLATSGDQSRALTTWSRVVSALERRAGSLGVSMALQRKQHDFLVGPAREQARDCGQDIDCLAEIGGTLGAQILVVGSASDRVTLYAIRVEDRSVLAKARSPTGNSIETRAQRAAIRLAKRLKKTLRQRPAREPSVLSADSGPPAASGPRPTGLLYIHRGGLTGVTRLSLDDQPIELTGEGFVSWPAAAGEHTLTAVHIDGRRSTQTIRLLSGQTTEVELDFAPAPPIPPAAGLAETPPSPRLTPDPTAPPAVRTDEDDDITGRWWFWTAIGTAVLAGAATAAVLAGGGKGGPTPPSETGSIQGTY